MLFDTGAPEIGLEFRPVNLILTGMMKRLFSINVFGLLNISPKRWRPLRTEDEKTMRLNRYHDISGELDLGACEEEVQTGG
jgi:hypothetical protein